MTPLNVVEHYYQMIAHLDNVEKQALVEKIQADIQTAQVSSPFFGVWEDERNADDIIMQIKEVAPTASIREHF